MKKYYFIGIGGIGMSGIAKILHADGNDVSGSDAAVNNETIALEKLDVIVNRTQVADNISDDIDIVVVTSAIPETNEELKRAKELGLKIVMRPVMLNEIITRHRAIAVTGTHGKTTTSSMLSEALITAGKDPLVVIGAEVANIGSNARTGNGEYSVAEVCEYQKAFLDIHPFAAIITNIDADHLDCYKDLNDIKDAFKIFVSQIDKEGFLVYCGDDINTQDIVDGHTGRKITYGFGVGLDYVATDIKITEDQTTFTVNNKNEYTLSVPGRHNILNALAVIATSAETGADKDIVRESLSRFRGADRRFQLKGFYNDAPIIDDYAHHPTEIKATLRAARDRYPEKNIIAVFQPHQHSRTKLLFDDFVGSFEDADVVLMPEIYAVRDSQEDVESVSSRDVVDKINEATPQKSIYFKSLEETKDYLKNNISKDDIIITIGAGPVYKIGDDLLA